MRRLAIVLLVVAIAMLVVVAPASAAGTLKGTFTTGMATPMAPPDGIWGPTALVASGQVIIVPGANVGVVARTVLITCADPNVMPFPLKFNMLWCKWSRAVWDGASYTVNGVLSKPGTPPFELTLVATPDSGALTMRIKTIGSVWGWDHWDLYGMLQ